MKEHLPRLSGQDWIIVVWHEGLPIDLPNRYIRKIAPKNFDWEDEGCQVKHRQATILSHRLPFSQDMFLLGPMRRTYNEVKNALGGTPDLVWTVTLSSAILWNWFDSRELINTPFFLQEHSNPLSMHLNKKYKLKAARSLVKRMKKVIVVAERQIQEFTDLSEGYNCEVISNPVDPTFLKNTITTPTNKSIIYVGRLSWEKGLQRLIMASRLILKKEPLLKVNIVGYGELEQELRQMVSDYQLESVVNFMGPKTADEIAFILGENEIFVLPSYYENCPVSLLEAQVKGVPCLVTNNGASEKVLLTGNGISLDDDGSGKQLAEGVRRLLNQSREYNRKEIRQRALKKFAPAVFAENFYSSFKEVMG